MHVVQKCEELGAASVCYAPVLMDAVHHIWTIAINASFQERAEAAKQAEREAIAAARRAGVLERAKEREEKKHAGEDLFNQVSYNSWL